MVGLRRAICTEVTVKLDDESERVVCKCTIINGWLAWNDDISLWQTSEPRRGIFKPGADDDDVDDDGRRKCVKLDI